MPDGKERVSEERISCVGGLVKKILRFFSSPAPFFKLRGGEKSRVCFPVYFLPHPFSFVRLAYFLTNCKLACKSRFAYWSASAGLPPSPPSREGRCMVISQIYFNIKRWDTHKLLAFPPSFFFFHRTRRKLKQK